MKKNSNANNLEENGNKITFAGYYKHIPAHPKKDFIEEVCRKCDVNVNTARSWATNKARPSKYSHYLALSDLTGIPAEDLFAE